VAGLGVHLAAVESDAPDLPALATLKLGKEFAEAGEQVALVIST